jgi:hypothetical protein
MKFLMLTILIITLISYFGCEQTTEPSSPYVYVNYEIESAFQNDSVEVYLDNQIILKSRVTTNYTISLAWSSGLEKLSRDYHMLRINVVDYGVKMDYPVETSNDTSTVLLRFNKDKKQISIKQIKGIYFRD